MITPVTTLYHIPQFPPLLTISKVFIQRTMEEWNNLHTPKCLLTQDSLLTFSLSLKQLLIIIITVILMKYLGKHLCHFVINHI